MIQPTSPAPRGLRIPDILVTVDVVLLTVGDERLRVALFKREHNDFAGLWALPGGFVDERVDDSVEMAAQRVLTSKTGIDNVWLEQLRVFSGRYRDPRRWSATIAHFALVPAQVLEHASRGAMGLFDVDQVPALPFDHNEIISVAVDRVRSKASYSSIATNFLPKEFTIPQFHSVQEALMGESINAGNLRRKLLEMDFLEPVHGKTFKVGRMKPAQIYRVKERNKKALKTRDRGLTPT